MQVVHRRSEGEQRRPIQYFIMGEAQHVCQGPGDDRLRLDACRGAIASIVQIDALGPFFTLPGARRTFLWANRPNNEDTAVF